MPEKDIEAVSELPHLNDLEASDQGNLKVIFWCGSSPCSRFQGPRLTSLTVALAGALAIVHL